MTARLRLWALVVFALTVLAFATVGDDLAEEASGLDVTPAVQTAGPAEWCGARLPHTGDRLAFSMRYDGYALAPHVAVFRCAAAHPGAAPGTGHFYDVLVWPGGRVEWVPLGPWWT